MLGLFVNMYQSLKKEKQNKKWLCNAEIKNECMGENAFASVGTQKKWRKKETNKNNFPQTFNSCFHIYHMREKLSMILKIHN